MTALGGTTPPQLLCQLRLAARLRKKQLDELDRPASLGGWDSTEIKLPLSFPQTARNTGIIFRVFPSCAHGRQTFLPGVNAKVAVNTLLTPAATGSLRECERGAGSDGIALFCPGVFISQYSASAGKRCPRFWNMTFCSVGEAERVTFPPPRAAVLQAGCLHTCSNAKALPRTCIDSSQLSRNIFCVTFNAEGLCD